MIIWVPSIEIEENIKYGMTKTETKALIKLLRRIINKLQKEVNRK